MIYNATKNFGTFGVPLTVLYEPNDYDANGNFTASMVAGITQRNLVCIDQESTTRGTPAGLLATLQQIEKSAAPAPAPLGFYGLPTFPWDGGEANWQAWMQQYTTVLQMTNVLFPCAYPRRATPDAWLTAFKLILNRCQAIDPNKPVYPFLWFEFEAPYGSGYIGDAYWDWMIKNALELTGNAVIWSNGQASPSDAAALKIIEAYS